MYERQGKNKSVALSWIGHKYNMKGILSYKNSFHFNMLVF